MEKRKRERFIKRSSEIENQEGERKIDAQTESVCVRERESLVWRKRERGRETAFIYLYSSSSKYLASAMKRQIGSQEKICCIFYSA